MASEVGDTIVLEERSSSIGLFPRPSRRLLEMKFFESLDEMDLVFSSSSIGDLEIMARPLLRMTSWMDSWFYAAKSLAVRDTTESSMVKCFFVAGARTQLLGAKTAFTIWANALFKCRDVVLGKVKDNISFDFFMELHNAPLCGLTKLFPYGALERAAEKSSQVLHDEAIRKVVTMGKKKKQILRKTIFPSRLVGGNQLGFWNPSHPDLCLGRVLILQVPRLLFHFQQAREGEVLKPPCLPFSHRWETL